MRTNTMATVSTSTGLVAFGESAVAGSFRRVLRGVALGALVLGALAEWGARRSWRRGDTGRWRAEWQTRWAKRVARVLRLRITLYGHLPPSGLLVVNEIGPLGWLVVAALGPIPLVSDPNAVEHAVQAEGVVAVPLRREGPYASVLERAAVARWPIAATWMEPLREGVWTLLAQPTVQITVAVASAEPASAAVRLMSDSLGEQLRLLAHATSDVHTAPGVVGAAGGHPSVGTAA